MNDARKKIIKGYWARSENLVRRAVTEGGLLAWFSVWFLGIAERKGIDVAHQALCNLFIDLRKACYLEGYQAVKLMLIKKGVPLSIDELFRFIYFYGYYYFSSCAGAPGGIKTPEEEELLQEGFRGIIEKMRTPGYQIQDPVFFIGRIIKCRKIDEIRKISRKRQYLGNTISDDNPLTLKLACNAENPERNYESLEIMNIAHTAASEDEDIALFLLKMETGLTYEELSELTGYSVDQLKRRCKMGLLKLREELRRKWA